MKSGKAFKKFQEETEEYSINSPDYYASGDVECIDAIRSALGQDGFIAYLRGTVMKYNWRLMTKGKPHRDTQKMRWFVARLEKELADRGK